MARTVGGRARPGRIAADVTSFMDRRAELADVRRLMSTSRLVTLTGVAGAGKTRLAVRAATELRRSYPDGVWQVDLAALDSGSMVQDTVAHALGLSNAAGGPTLQLLVDHLADRELLLLLDNCEHVLDDCAPLVDSLLRAAPKLHVLCTSRQPLGIVGETVRAVPPLPAADAGDAAVTLFVARATAAAPNFTLTPDNREAVIEICRRLDGLPLAIELAAAQVRTRSVDQLAHGLGDGFRLLTTRHAMPAHHRTLEDTFDWSFALCSPAEQSAWTRVSVFTEGFGPDAATAVCTDADLPADALTEALAGLVDKSVVLREERAGRTRYRLLETVRRFGLSRLRTGDDGVYVALRLRHRDWYVGLAERFEADWFGPRQVQWLEYLWTEWANLRTALDASRTIPGGEEAGLRLTAALLYFWLAGGALREGWYWLDQTLTASPQPTVARTRALHAFCRVLVQSDSTHPLGSARADEGLRLARQFDDPALVAHALYVLGLYAQYADDESGAATLLAGAVQSFAEQGRMDATVAAAQFSYALTVLFAGDADRAAEICHQGYHACLAYGDRWGRSQLLGCMAVVAMAEGDIERGRSYIVERLKIKRTLGDTLGVAIGLDLSAAFAVATGAYERGARLRGAAGRVWQDMGQPGHMSALFRRWLYGYIDAARAALGATAFDRAAGCGAMLTEDEAVAEALEEVPPGRSPDEARTPLTRREREVAELIAQALSNRQIAARLVISQRTAESHVESILNKLGFTSRTQVVGWLANHPDT